MLEPIKFIKRGIEEKLQTEPANVFNLSLFQAFLQHISLLECQVTDLRDGHNNLSAKITPAVKFDLRVGNFQSAIN